MRCPKTSGSRPPALCTTNGKSVAEVRASQTNDTGQHDGYIVLCPDERAKGFVRPYRDRYRHSAHRTGVTTLARVRGFLRSEGATDEQLAELDARLTSAIERREAEHGGA